MQELARRSQWWWDSFPARTHLPIDQLTVSYMTRSGNVSLERFAASTPDVTRAGLAQYAGVAPVDVDLSSPVEWVIDRPMEGFARRVVDRSTFAAAGVVEVNEIPDDPWGPEASALVEQIAQSGRRVWINASDRAGLLTRLDLAERFRLAGAQVVTEGPADLLPDLAAGLAAARTDFVAIRSTR
jgi:anthraniloyl-CoA monooxygenase